MTCNTILSCVHGVCAVVQRRSCKRQQADEGGSTDGQPPGPSVIMVMGGDNKNCTGHTEHDPRSQGVFGCPTTGCLMRPLYWAEGNMHCSAADRSARHLCSINPTALQARCQARCKLSFKADSMTTPLSQPPGWCSKQRDVASMFVCAGGQLRHCIQAAEVPAA